MSLVRRAIPFFIALVFVAPGQAATTPKPEPAPEGLHGFHLRTDEPLTDTFSRTPSFAWKRVPGVLKYEFELSLSSRFIESAQVWTGEIARTPAVSVPLALPWMTGKPYAFHARVRTVSTTGRSGWSKEFHFNTRPDDAPKQAPSYPGLVRWTTVDGATSYQVWWTDLKKQISTLTNSADEREFYTLHQQAPWPSIVNWRVRAVRSVYGGLPNGLPAVSYGAWSPTFISYNPPFPVGPIGLSSTVSATVDASPDGNSMFPHSQTPAFLFGGTQSLSFLETELYRVYVSTDSDCLNHVYRGAIVGSPAYSPRTSGPLLLPHPISADSRTKYLRDGSEGLTAMADQTKAVSNEEQVATSTTPPSESGTPTETPPAEEPASTGFTLPVAKGPLVDLWDIGRETGTYWWTIVPVEAVSDYVRDENGKETSTPVPIYRDMELPQEACAAGRVHSFGKESETALVSEKPAPPYDASAPYVSGLTTDGEFISARKEVPVFYGTPLVAWRPALGAAAYEVQWSKAAYPWSTVGTVFTFGTSALLQDSGKTLAPGTWHYRVRGLNPYFASPIKAMSWPDKPVEILVAKPSYAVVKGTTEEKEKEESAKLSFRTWIGSGFAVALPTSWKKLKTNPFAKFYLAKGALKNISLDKASLRFMAHDPADNGNTTGVSVFYVPTPLAHTHASWVKAVKETVGKQKRLVGKPFCVESVVPAGSTLKCAYSFQVANSKLVESEVSYWFDRVDKTYVLALDNLRSANKANASLRLSIAKKFKITS